MAIVSRQIRFARARQLLIEYPEWGRRRINAQLRAEYGLGLRDAAIDAISDQLNRPSVLRAKLNTRYVFSPLERRVFANFLRKGNPPYLREAINNRWALYKRARREGWGRQNFILAIRQEYKDKGWLAKTTTRSKKNPLGRVRGRPDPWEMLRYFRDRAIEAGDYNPVPKVKARAGQEDISTRRKGHQEKQQRKSIESKQEQYKHYLMQIDMQIASASGSRLAQLQQQKDNLQRELRNLQ